MRFCGRFENKLIEQGEEEKKAMEPIMMCFLVISRNQIFLKNAPIFQTIKLHHRSINIWF